MARVDPYKNFRFLVETDSIVNAGFSECTGLGSQVQVVEFREGGDPAYVRKLRGQTTFPDITLKWGLANAEFNRKLYEWHLAAVEGEELERQNGSVILLDDKGQEAARWNFFNAWPSQYEAPTFNATANEVAIETLTLSCERVVRVQG
jgi:phage tail-like protein